MPISEIFKRKTLKESVEISDSPGLLELMDNSSDGAKPVIISAKFTVSDVAEFSDVDEKNIAMFVLDASGSMTCFNSTINTSLINSSKTLMKQVTNISIMEILFYGNEIESRDLCPAECYTPNYKAKGACTNLYDSILWSVARAVEMKHTYYTNDITSKINVCIFTDGQDNNSTVTKADVVNAVGKANEENIELFAIACGVNKNIFTDLGFNSRNVFRCESVASEIEGIFGNVSKRMSQHLSNKF